MANNRLQIYCLECLEFKAIIKFYPSIGWYGVSDKNEVDNFVREHSKKHGEHKEYLFAFRYEDADDNFVANYNCFPRKLIKK